MIKAKNIRAFFRRNPSLGLGTVGNRDDGQGVDSQIAINAIKIKVFLGGGGGGG